MAKQSITLLTSTAGQLNVTSQAVKATGFYGYTSGSSTIAWYMGDLIGRVYIEASLATNPSDSDWFQIPLTNTTTYKQYPLNPLYPTGTTGDTGIDYFTFSGNFVWLRFRLDRSYLVMPNITDVGIISRVYLNY